MFARDGARSEHFDAAEVADRKRCGDALHLQKE
jgi:hypothetical protein